jgi:DNA-binding protein H-NS
MSYNCCPEIMVSMGVIVMKQVNLERLSTDDLWALHAKVSEVLGQRIQQEKLLLEERLKQLRVRESGRRPYPPVLPKYCNPDRPSETWAGRGKQPRWMVAQLKAGRRLDDFRIRRGRRAQVGASLN